MCFKLVFRFFHKGLPKDNHNIHPVFQHATSTSDRGHWRVLLGEAVASGWFCHMRAWTDCIYYWRWAGLIAANQLPSSQTCQHSPPGVQLEMAPRDMAVSSERDSGFPLQTYMDFSQRKAASERVLLQSFKVFPAVLHNIHVHQDC